MKRILLLSLLLLPIVALAQYPTFSNKQKLGVQTTGDGLIFRGTTINNIPNYTPSNVNNAYFHLDTTTNKLYLYNDGWQLVYPTTQFDTTTLNVYLKISDTTAMLLPYFRDSDTTSLNLINRFALKLNISDTATMLTPYMKKADTISLSNRINLKLNISDTTILSNRITTNANNIITINNKLATKLDTIYVKFKDVVTMIENKDTINIGSSLIDGYAINIIGDSVNVDSIILDNRYPDRDTTNELQDITFATTSGIVTISGGKVMNLDTLYNSVIDSVNLLIRDSIAAFTPLTEGYGINIIGDSINVDTSIIFTQSDTITLSNRIDLKLNTSDTITLSNRIDTKLNVSDTASLSNRINLKLNISDTLSMLAPYLREADTISLSNRINTKLDTIYVNYQTNVDVITNKDTINITPLTEGFGINIIGDSINIDSAVILATQQKQIAYVKNQSGVTIYKGQAVYSSGSSGNNKLVTLASSAIEQTSSKTFGVVETDSIPNGSHGYIITFGLLSGINTNNLTEGSSIYLSNTPGQLTTTKPQAPLHMVVIGVCIRQQQNNGSIFVKIQNGFELDELHDVRLTDLVDKSSIYYNLSEKLWRDTTAALLVSDTVSMLSKYVNTYSNQTEINGDKTFNNIVTIDSATVTGKLLVSTNISDAVKISSNTNSTNLELANSSGNSVFIKSTNRNMVLQTDTTALMYLNGENNKVGILTMSPEQALQVSGTIRVDSLVNNLTPVKLVGGSNSNDLTNVELGTGLSFINDTLKIADNIINSGDTATLLRKDFLGIDTNVLVWTEGNKKLLPYFTQIYRNGQLLKYENQYTITNDSIVTLEEGSYKLGDNITIIAIDNIIALAGSGGVISLSGHVSGSGTSNINTTINNGVVTNSMLAGSISDSKLNNITTAGKVSNSATTATNINTNNAIVLRDASGNFIAGTITASLNGNANTSTTLATGRTIAITGDLTYTSPSFNGSTNVTAVGTLANSGVTANTYTAATVTVDAKGRVTSASSNTIPTVNNGTLTMAVSGNGLTGSQTFTANQSSAATFTVNSNATSSNIASTIIYRDASGNFSAGNITASNFYGNATSSTNSVFAASVTNYLNTNEIFKFKTTNAPNVSGPRIVTTPGTDFSVARIDAAQTFTGTQTFNSTISGSIDGNAATVTTNANLTGDVTSTGNNTSIATGVIVNADINASAAIAVSKLAASTISGITLGNNLNTLTISTPLTGTSYNGNSAVSIGIQAATTSVAGSMSAADKTKLDGIASNAINKTGLSFVAGSGAYNNTTGVITIPTNNNQITNGAGYITSSSLSSYLPLTGGTLTGALSGTTGTFTGLNINNTNVNGEGILTLKSYNFNFANRIQFGDGSVIRREIIYPNSSSNMQFRSYTVGGSSGGYDFYVSNGSTESLAATIGTDKSLSLTGTLGVTGATMLTGALSGTTGVFNTKLAAGDIGGSSGSPVFTAGLSGTETEFHIYQGTGYELSPTTLRLTNNNGSYYQNGLFLKSIMERGLNEYNGRIGIMATDFMILTKNSRIGIFNPSPSTTLDITGTLNATGATTLGSTLAVTGAITEGGNNVLTNLDTVSLSSRIDAKYNSAGGTISGSVTLSTTTATPSTLLGKDGSNVVGAVTTVAQTGLMKAGGVTQNTSSVGIISVAHGLSYEPSQVIVTLAQQNSYIVVCHNITATDLFFTVYDSVTGNPLDNISVGIFWLALK